MMKAEEPDGEVVTLGRGKVPQLEDVQQHRQQLFGLLLLVFILAAAGVMLFSYASEVLLGDPLLDVVDVGTLRVAFVALAAAFGLYVWERERSLSRVERALIEERILSEALSSRVRELNAISRAGRAVASVLSLDDVLDLILDSARELLAADEGSIMLLEPENEVLRMAASVGLEETELTRSIPIGESVAGWVVALREPVILRGDVSHLRDQPFDQFVPKGRRIRSAMSVPLFARGQPVGVLNVSVSRSDREYQDPDLRALTVFAEHAAVAIANARLIARERAVSRRLEELDTQRREFLAVVAHDLKAPLTSILGYARLLQDLGDATTLEQRRDFADIIARQGGRMLDMLEQLIMAISVDEGAPILSIEPLDLGEIVRDELTAMGGMLGDRAVEVDIPSTLPTVFGDRSAVGHILANLLDNAVKHSGGREDVAIKVTAEAAGEEVRVTVADGGPGFPEDTLPNVFERYRRGGGAARPSGAGLGLFIVRSLSQGHGGRVWAGNAPGGGAVVTFTLPLRASELPALEVIGAANGDDRFVDAPVSPIDATR